MTVPLLAEKEACFGYIDTISPGLYPFCGKVNGQFAGNTRMIIGSSAIQIDAILKIRSAVNYGNLNIDSFSAEILHRLPKPRVGEKFPCSELTPPAGHPAHQLVS